MIFAHEYYLLQVNSKKGKDIDMEIYVLKTI